MTVRAGAERWRRVGVAAVAVIVVASAAAFVIANGNHATALAGVAGSIDLRVASLGLACSVLAIANRGMLNHAAHRAVGLEAGRGAMTHTAAVGFAAQKMVKSAGAVGLAVFLHHGRRRGHAPAAVTAACLLTATASFAALGLLLSAAVAVLAVTGRLTGWWIAASLGFAIYAVTVAVAGAVVLRSRVAAEWTWRLGQRVGGWLPWRRRGVASGQTAQMPNDLFDAVANARTRPDAVRQLLAHAVLSKLLGAAALAAAVAAVGLPVTAAGAVVIYATALAASLVTIVPGGFGTVEASTAALLIGAGATAGAAAAAVALFRLFDLWVPVITGAVVARRDARRERRAEQLAMPAAYALEVARIEHWPQSRY